MQSYALSQLILVYLCPNSDPYISIGVIYALKILKNICFGIRQYLKSWLRTEINTQLVLTAC